MSFATIASRSAELRSHEAVALVLGAARACEVRLPGVACLTPSAEQILLSRTGRVAVTGAVRAASDAERVARLAALLRLLLGLDAQCPGVSRADVPGALMLMMARTAGEIDLPAPSYAEFVDALRRVAPADEASLAAVHARFGPSHRARQFRVVEAVAASLVIVAACAVFLTVARPGRHDPPAAVPAEVAAAEQSESSLPPDARRTPALTAAPLMSSADLGADVFSPSFSDEDELLFHAGRQRAALMRASFDASGRAAIETILADGATNYHAVASPDGRRLAFDSDRDGTRGVYVADADASGARRISGDGYAAVPRWSPDGQRIAFIRADAERPRVWNVWVADVASGALRQVSRHRVGQAWGASWFPDGERLAYSVEDRLVVSDLRTGTRRVVPSPRTGHLVRTPAVSPDGAWIVFQVHRDGVWLLEVATGRTHRVLRDPAAEEFAWSPDGRSIAFHTRRAGAWSLWQLSFVRQRT